MEQFASLKRSKDGQPVRFLVVDDSVFARKNLARIVEAFGGQVAGEAGDGMTAITEYDRTNPDIVLMDITMPQMEGIEAAERIVQQHPEARIVETFGGQVAGEAGDGMTAITEYDRTNPDIVLMDITMPQMEGIEAAEKIVAQHPEARIVMVSSVGYQENIVAALQRGARHFVQKPVKPEVLYEVIKYVLGEDGAVASAAGAGA